MTPFWKGFVDGLLLVAMGFCALFAGVAIWAMIAFVVGGKWALAIIISAFGFAGLMGLLYASTAYDALDDAEDDHEWDNKS